MKTLTQLISEYKTKDETVIKCKKTGEVIDPEYVIYDKSSLDKYIQDYKNNKDNWKEKSFYTVQQKGSDWTADTQNPLNLNIYRMTDQFLSSEKAKWSYDDICKMLDEGIMLIVV